MGLSAQFSGSSFAIDAHSVCIAIVFLSNSLLFHGDWRAHTAYEDILLRHCDAYQSPVDGERRETVCLMSLTANLPRGGNSAKGSTHMGLLGSSLTMAASPDLMNLGASSVDLPVRLSTFSRISANLQAMWAVWQSSTGE